MSKYDSLWKYVAQSEQDVFKLTFSEIDQIAGLPIDHSFLSFKKELNGYGYQVGKISMKKHSIFIENRDIKIAVVLYLIFPVTSNQWKCS